MSENYIIAIDGTVASGKGTVAKLLAKKFGIITLSTGAIYRAICIYFMDKKISTDELEKIEKLVESVDIKVECLDGRTNVKIDGKDVTNRLEDIKTSENVASYAKISVVRTKVKSVQKYIAENQSLVCEGRDITSVVFPNAKYKFYLTASAKVRALRRHNQEIARGEDIGYRAVYDGIIERDHMDMTREVSPLVIVRGAKVIDSSKLNADQTVELMYRHIEKLRRIENKKETKRANLIAKDFKRPFGHNLFRKILKCLWLPYRLLCPFKIIGKKELKKLSGKPVIFAVNHRSNWDAIAFFMAFANRKLHFIGKEGLFKKELHSGILRSVNVFPTRKGNDLAVIRHSLDILKRGENLCIYPEGRRNFNTEDAGAIRNGTAVIAIRAGVPVVPIVTNRAPRMFKRVTFKIGSPLYPENFSNKHEFSDALRDSMSEMLNGFEIKPKQKNWDIEPIVNVRGIVIRDNKLLLVKRVRENETYYVFPGGHVDEGETPRDATPREVKEETDVDCKVTRILYKSRMPKKLGNQEGQIQGFYLCEYIKGEAQPTNAEEYTRGENHITYDGRPQGKYIPIFVDVSELDKIDLKPNSIRDQLLKDIKKYSVHLTRTTKFVK